MLGTSCVQHAVNGLGDIRRRAVFERGVRLEDGRFANRGLLEWLDLEDFRIVGGRRSSGLGFGGRFAL